MFESKLSNCYRKNATSRYIKKVFIHKVYNALKFKL